MKSSLLAELLNLGRDGKLRWQSCWMVVTLRIACNQASTLLDCSNRRRRLIIVLGQLHEPHNRKTLAKRLDIHDYIEAVDWNPASGNTRAMRIDWWLVGGCRQLHIVFGWRARSGCHG